MKTFTYITNFFVIIVILLAANYFLKVITVPQWLIMVICLIAIILVFTRVYLRFTRR